MSRGDTLTETWTYNSRFQPQSVAAWAAFSLSLSYCANKGLACTTNNGNVMTITPAIPGIDQTAGYYKVNRLQSFQEGTSSQSYAYDPPGSGRGEPLGLSEFRIFSAYGYMPTTSSGYSVDANEKRRTVLRIINTTNPQPCRPVVEIWRSCWEKTLGYAET